jgi:hypothetical protein
MSLLIAALALAAAQPAAEPPVVDEIVVMGNKLRDWRGTWRVRDGVVKCKTKRSTGDREIDAIGCGAMVNCMTPLVPQWQAIEDADLPKAELEARLNGLLQTAKVSDCFKAAREQSISALVTARRSARS